MNTAQTSTDGASIESRSAGGDLVSHLRFWPIAGAALALDLWSKSAAFSQLPAHGATPLIPHVLELRRSLNDGAVFGSFTGNVEVFIAASLLALAFVVYLFVHSRHTQWALHVALGLVLSGALGNLYDRAFIKADVVEAMGSDQVKRSAIGTIVGERDGASVELGDWPDGANSIRIRNAVEVRRQGVVRDFLKLVPRFPSWVPGLGGSDVWPWIFNIADTALVVGVLLLLVHTWLDGTPRASPS